VPRALLVYPHQPNNPQCPPYQIHPVVCITGFGQWASPAKTAASARLGETVKLEHWRT
jgi:hypothetical protein